MDTMKDVEMDATKASGAVQRVLGSPWGFVLGSQARPGGVGNILLAQQ